VLAQDMRGCAHWTAISSRSLLFLRLMSDNVFGVTPDPAVDHEVSPPLESGPKEADEAREPDPAPEPPPAEPAKPAREADEDEDQDELSADPEQGFRIGNKVYKDVEAADRAFKRQQGRATAAERRRKETEERLARAESLLEQSLRAHSQPQVQDDQGTPAQPPPPPQPKRLTDLVSGEEFDALVVEHGPAKAFARLAELTEQRLTEALEERDRETRPLVRERQAADATAKTFDSAAELVDETGKPLYPEIADPNSPQAQAVFALWQRNFRDPALAPLAFTQHGIEIAINKFRADNGQPASRGPRTPAGASTSARRAADQSLQSMGTDSRGSARPGAAGPVGRDDEERIQAAQRAARHPIFGVTVRASA
jgi:hypothetical protein